MKLCYIDFEYRGTNEENLDLVSCSFSLSESKESFTYWLFSKKYREDLKHHLRDISDEGYTFVAYAVTAEASAFYSLGFKEPWKFKWIDLYLEYRCLTNHNHRLMYGKQLIDGNVKTTYPPPGKYKMNEEEREKSKYQRPQHSMAAACYKLLGVKVDTDFKDEIRDIIIKGSDEEIIAAKGEILRYNESDIKYLPMLLKEVKNEYKRLLRGRYNGGQLLEEIYARGDYAARSAAMERIGYPIDRQSTENFSKSANGILHALQSEINELFPQILPFTQKSDLTFSWSHVRTREWIETLPVSVKGKWLRTEKGAYSLKVDAFEEHYPYRHEYPKDCFGGQILRYLRTKRNLNGFTQSKTAKKKKNFWNSVGSDDRVRPYFGIYGAQSARSQPSATSFLFLKSAWMRALCVPPKGKAIVGIDYKSQEFLIAALLSEDPVMVEAYHSGDVYLYLAKVAGAVPWNGLKKDYKEERDIFKQVTLSLQFGMGARGLANRLTLVTKRTWSEDEAQKLINKFNSGYKKHFLYKKEQPRNYRVQGHFKLIDGWYMWGDNENKRSAGNFPIQGMGSSIMRKAVTSAQDAGLKVIMTLHDALYCEYDIGNERDIITLASCMRKAFEDSFPQIDDKKHKTVGLDANVWSPEYENGFFEVEGLGKVKKQSIYIDERAEKEYETFKQYFKEEEFNL